MVTLLSVSRTEARAQSPDREPALMEVPASTRAVGLGHAFQLDALDSDVVFYNPSQVGRGNGMMLSYHRFGATATALGVSAERSWLGGGIAIGLRSLEYGSDGPGTRLRGLDPLLKRGPVGVSEHVAVAAYARTIGPVRAGVAGKLVNHRAEDDNDTRGAVDVGVSAELGPLRVGLAARNLGGDYVLAGARVHMPEEVTLGAGGYGHQLGPLDLGVAAAVTRRADGEWLAGGGVEMGYWPVSGRTFVGRIGVRRVPEGEALPVTFGGSFWGDDLVVEYAFQPVDGHDGIHRLTVGWR